MGRKTKQNKITNPELISQINPKNVRLMNDFLEYLRSIGKAESTVKAYTSDLYIFFVWVLQNADNKYFPEVTKRDIISYQNWLLRSNENSPARVRRLKSTLSSLSNYIEAILDDELPNFRSIVRKIENPVNEPTREKTVLTDEQADYLLPMNINFGIITPLGYRVKGKRNKNAEISRRSLEIIEKMKDREVLKL